MSGYTCIHLFSPRAGGGFPSAPPNFQTIAPRAAVLPEPRTKAVFLLICSPADSSCLQRWSGWELGVHLLHFSTGSNQGRGLTRTFFSAEKMDHSAATRFPFLSNFLIYPETGKARMRRPITVYLYSYISKIYLFSVKLYGWCDIFTFTVGCHTYVTRDICCTRKWSSDTSFLLTSP